MPLFRKAGSFLPLAGGALSGALTAGLAVDYLGTNALSVFAAGGLTTLSTAYGGFWFQNNIAMVNDALLYNASTGAALQFTSGGDIKFAGGPMRFGTHSALGGETLSGFITIKDEAGTSRKVAVVS